MELPQKKPDSIYARFELEQTLNKASEWFHEHFLTENTLYQWIMLAAAFVTASILYQAIKDKLAKAIDDSELPIRVKKIAQNLSKLVMPLSLLTIMFILTLAARNEPVGLDVSLSVGVMKVLLAWIVIRIAVQFIENRIVRNFFAVSIWTVAALSIFGILDETTAVLDAVGIDLGDFRLSALAVIKGIILLFILLYMAIFVSTFAERRVFQVKSLTRSSQVLIAKIIRITLVVVALLAGLTSAGIDLSLFAVFSGAIGLGIGFGLQKGVSNLFSGLLLLLDKSIEPGDVLELEGGTFGWVESMGARYTEIVTRDNKSYLIPNEDFITQRVVNWSHGSTLIRLEVEFGVDYAHNPHEVKRIAEEAAVKPDRVVKDPSPVCHLTEFGESSLNFKLRFWIRDAQKGVTNMRGEVMLALWDAFREYGIKIPYPHREILITRERTA